MPINRQHFFRKSSFIVSVFCVWNLSLQAQYHFITQAAPAERIQVLWKYCMANLISDQDPESVSAFFKGVGYTADSLGDKQLKAYSEYFQRCSLILFSENYEQHFAPNDYKTVINTFSKAAEAGLKDGFEDIAASAEHYIGQVYYRADLYGQAFEYLLKADARMKRLGYENVPAVSVYLYELGLNYYRFEDYDKALALFTEAVRYPVYVSNFQLSSFNAIGLIYLKQMKLDSAITHFHKTIALAKQYHDSAWIGIASGNLGSVYLKKGNFKEALADFSTNYRINGFYNSFGRNDAALTAIYIAKAYAGLGLTDSASFYLQSGMQLVEHEIIDKNEWLNLYKNYLEASTTIYRKKGAYEAALQTADTLLLINDSIHKKLDGRILNRAVQKAEAERNLAELQLLESKKNISQLRFVLVIGGLAGMLVVILLVFRNYRRRRIEKDKLLEKEKELLSIEKLRAEENLQHSQDQLSNYLNTIREKNNYIETLAAEMNFLKESNHQLIEAPPTLQVLLSKTILTDSDWLHFRGLFEQVYPGFIDRLFTRFPQLSPAESRLLILSRLDLSSRDMANMVGVSIDAIRKLRYRLRKKLGLEEDVDFGAVMKAI